MFVVVDVVRVDPVVVDVVVVVVAVVAVVVVVVVAAVVVSVAVDVVGDVAEPSNDAGFSSMSSSSVPSPPPLCRQKK